MGCSKKDRLIRKFLKIMAWTVGITVLLLFGAAIAAQTAAVQTMLAKRAMKMLGNRIDAEVIFERISVSPMMGVSVKGVALLDRNACGCSDKPVQDTLFSADYVTATFSPRNLLSKKGLFLNQARVVNGLFALVSEPCDNVKGKTTNLKRIFSVQPREKKEKKGSFHMRIAKVDVEGLEFRMISHCPGTKEEPSGAINWKDLDISDIYLKGRNLEIDGGVVSGEVKSLSFTEKSGFRAANISGRTKVGNGLTLVRNLKIDDGMSGISMTEFSMSYENSKSFSDFVNKVSLHAEIEPSGLNMESLAFFAGSLSGMDLDVTLEGGLDGTVSDFSLKGLKVSGNRDGFRATLDGSISGLPETDRMNLNLRLGDASFTLGELESLIMGFSPGSRLGIGHMAPGQRFRTDATVRGRLDRMQTEVKAAAGGSMLNASLLLTGLLDRHMSPGLRGNVDCQDLDLGSFLPGKALGRASFRAEADASFGKGAARVDLDTLEIMQLHFNGHDFSGMSATGSYSPEGFDISFGSSDPALTATLTASAEKDGARGLSEEGLPAGYLMLRADIANADFGALGLKKYAGSSASFSAEAYADGRKGTDLDGSISLSGVELRDSSSARSIGDMLIDLSSAEQRERIDISSDLISGSFSGSSDIVEFFRDLVNLSAKREFPSVFNGEGREWSGNDYELQLQINDSNDALSFFVPGLYIADSTSVRMRIDGNGQVHGRVRSDRIALGNRYLRNLRLSIDGRDSNLDLVLNSDELAFPPLLMRSDRIMVLASEDSFGMSVAFDNDTEPVNKGELFLRGGFSRDDQDRLVTDISILPSNIYVNSNAWSLSPADIRLNGGRVSIHGLTLDNESQSIRIDGAYDRTAGDSLTVQLEHFDIAALQPLLPGGMTISGYADGTGVLQSTGEPTPGLLLNLGITDCMLAGRPAGELSLSSSYNKEAEGFDVSVRNSLDGHSNIVASALLGLRDKVLDGRIGLSEFDLGYAYPFLSSVFSEFGGLLSGSIRVSGPLSSLDISSNGLRLDDGLMKVDFTGVPYKVSGPLRLDNGGAWFMDNRVEDRYGNSGVISGGIAWNHFKDMRFDTRLDFSEMEVVDIAASDSQPFYGNISASGRLNISGPMNSLKLDVDASTAREGSFHVPMSSSIMAGSSDILTFKEPGKAVVTDRYERMMGRIEEGSRSGNDLGISLRINVDQAIQAFVEIDKASGNVLTGRGNGELELEVRPARDIFNINGKYDLVSGNYHLDVLGIAQKDFAIQDGSSIRFAGDIMDSELDIDALYRTKAVVGTLIADTTSTARRNVECGIRISDRIRNPQVSFSIDIPDLDPTTQAMVENALNTEDKVQKQFLSLLLSSSFLPDDNSGIVNNSNMFNTTISEIMAGQLNNILQKLDIPVDLGLDFQSGTNGKSVYDVAISTQLFNNRVIVNGTIGNRMYSNSATGGNEVVGDLDIEIKIDKKGALRFNLFSHSADQYTSYLDASQRNGLGLTYQREFDSVREFLDSIFLPKKKREEAHQATGATSVTREKRKTIIIE